MSCETIWPLPVVNQTPVAQVQVCYSGESITDRAQREFEELEHNLKQDNGDLSPGDVEDLKSLMEFMYLGLGVQLHHIPESRAAVKVKRASRQYSMLYCSI